MINEVMKFPLINRKEEISENIGNAPILLT